SPGGAQGLLLSGVEGRHGFAGPPRALGGVGGHLGAPHVLVDADACPQVIKEILFRAAERAQVLTTLVSNMPLSRTPTSPYIRTIRVAKGFDGADDRILAEMQPGDLVVTADLPLASEVVTRGGHALDPRGELYSEDNVRERL